MIDSVPLPKREKDKPFLLPVEQVFSIVGRGTVVTGRIERGTLVPQTAVEIIGYNQITKSVVTGRFIYVLKFIKLFIVVIAALTLSWLSRNCLCLFGQSNKGFLNLQAVPKSAFISL